MGELYVVYPRDNGRRKAKRDVAEFFQILGRGNGKKRMARYVTQSVELHAEDPLPPDLLDELRDESTRRVFLKLIGDEVTETIWRNIDNALLHGTPEQRQARTRAAVRANIRAANKKDT